MYNVKVKYNKINNKRSNSQSHIRHTPKEAMRSYQHNESSSVKESEKMRAPYILRKMYVTYDLQG